MTKPIDFDRLIQRACELGAIEAKPIDPKSIVLAPWVRLKCQFGCAHYNTRFCCPPYTPTPEQFQDFLCSAIDWMDEHPEQTTAERLVLIYAWNEFGEGGYIAPTKGDPDGAYLKVIKSVVQGGEAACADVRAATSEVDPATR